MGSLQSTLAPMRKPKVSHYSEGGKYNDVIVKSDEIQQELIRELKMNLQQETQINLELRTKLETIARRALADKENSEAEKMALNQKL